MQPLLIVCHSPSPNTQRMADAVVSGARQMAGADLDVVLQSPFDCGPQAVRDCAGLILGCTENFGYMAGALKDFFERIYYPCQEKTEGLPYALFVKAGNDGSGAVNSVERIVTGMRWRAVANPVVCVGAPDKAALAACEELGATLAAGLEAGIW